jgi:mono/diheme cytochrome c family protein
VPADTASLARGQQVYDANCASCHGDTGRGDGPAGRALRPRPADFRVHMAAGHTDQELFNWVTNGVDGTGMPAFRAQLSEQERWDVINYIRSFAAQR